MCQLGRKFEFGMNELLLLGGRRVLFEYDAGQDMLYVFFREKVGTTYYADVPSLPGVMLRHDAATNDVVGMTVHNVQRKLMQKLIMELGDQVLPNAA